MKFIKKHYDLLSEILIYILYTIAIVVAVGLMGRYHTDIAAILNIADEVTLNLDSLASIVGIVAAAMAIIISNRQEANKALHAKRDEIYQQLELESINLFRFEIDNTELARTIWDDTKTHEELVADKINGYRVLQHLCQILNLFEMVVRSKHNGAVHDDMFTSWEAWIYDLCRSELFLHYWYLEDIRSNYIGLFQGIVDTGLLSAHGKEKVETVIARQNDDEDAGFATFVHSIRQQLENH